MILHVNSHIETSHAQLAFPFIFARWNFRTAIKRKTLTTPEKPTEATNRGFVGCLSKPLFLFLDMELNADVKRDSHSHTQ